ARLRRIPTLAPASFRHRAPPLEARLESEHAAQTSLRHQLLDSDKVAIPAAILEHGEQNTSLSRFGDQRAPCRGGRREWLVAYDGEARRQRSAGERRVRAIRRRDHHEIQLACQIP